MQQKENVILLEGEIVDILGGGRYKVALDGMEMTVDAKAAGKLKMNKIKIIVGDRVQVELNEYDPTKGRIIYRYTNMSSR